ncbi:hypothetical protein JCM10213_003541 [Rhodosporidiobolus nylandii]
MADTLARLWGSLSAATAPAPPVAVAPAAPSLVNLLRLQGGERLVAAVEDVVGVDAGGRTLAGQGRRSAGRGFALVVRGEEGGANNGDEEEGVILVYRRIAGPAAEPAVEIERVLPVEERFTVDIQQAQGGSFLITLSAPALSFTLSSGTSSPSQTSPAASDATTNTSFTFLSDPTLPEPVTAILAAVKRLHGLAIEQKLQPGGDEKRWEWAQVYAARADGVATGEGKGRRLASQFEGSLGAAYSARRTNSSRPTLSSLNWSSPPPSSSSTFLPGGFSPLSPTNSATSPVAEGGEDSLYSRETHAAMERWLVQRMREREEEFLQREEIRVWCGTFNVNDKQPKNGASDIQAWVATAAGAELLVFGFQELDLTAEALLRYTPYREEVWRKAIEEALANKAGGDAESVAGKEWGRYEKLHSRQLVGVLLLVYARSDILPHISDVSSASLATGLMGLVANKGGVGIRLRYKDTPLTFVNSHLAAFTQNVSQRNAQVRDTATTLVFPLSGSSPSPSSEAAAVQTSRDPWTPNLRPDAVRPLQGEQGEGYSVWDCDTLFWLGDLNYRLDLPRNEVQRMLEAKEYDLLQQFDQLRIQRQHRLAFSDFEEAKIAFPCSFKYDVGTTVYDTSDKQRVPSWTDRILWLSVHEKSVVCDRYDSYPGVVMSDHKPVSALLRVPVYTAVPDKRNEVQQQVIAELDSFDNDALPDVKLSPGPSVEFGEICYDEPVSQQIELVNVGQVLAPWSFVCKPGSSSLAPPWLTLSPTSGLILPGERCTITLTTHVTSASASSLNFPLPSAEPPLSELLILSVEKKDLFLSVSARAWVPTVFGSSLEQLVRLHGPLRSLSLEQRESIALAASGEKEKEGDEIGASSVPQVLHRLVAFLAEYALDVKDLFAVAGESELVKAVRECLDTGSDFPLDRLLPSSSSSAAPASPSSPDDDKQHLHDAVSALEHLESDIGSISLSSPPLALADDGHRARSLSLVAPSADDEDDGRFAGLHSVTDCTLKLLESLKEPVVPDELYVQALKAETREEAYSVVQALPEVHANTLLYILAFLRVLLAQTAAPLARVARADRLAVVFSAVLLRPPTSSVASSATFSSAGKIDPATVPRRSKTFVLLLLQEGAEGTGSAEE